MRRKIMFIAVVTFLMYLIFGALLAHWWHHDKDAFWIAVSIYGVVAFLFAACLKIEVSIDDGRSN